jgi:hypothetical protein
MRLAPAEEAFVAAFTNNLEDVLGREGGTAFSKWGRREHPDPRGGLALRPAKDLERATNPLQGAAWWLRQTGKQEVDSSGARTLHERAAPQW